MSSHPNQYKAVPFFFFKLLLWFTVELVIIFIQLMKVIYKLPLTQIHDLIRFKLHTHAHSEEVGWSLFLNWRHASVCSQRSRSSDVLPLPSLPLSEHMTYAMRHWEPPGWFPHPVTAHALWVLALGSVKIPNEDPETIILLSPLYPRLTSSCSVGLTFPLHDMTDYWSLKGVS